MKHNDFLSKKNKVLRFFISAVFAIGTLSLMISLSDGPRLGSFYDFLLKLKPKKAASPKLLIINVEDNFIVASDAVSLINTLAEMEAKTLLLEIPVLGVSSGGSANESELLLHFDEEFSLISSNIRNLFDGIRTGSIAPSEARNFVQGVLKLTDGSKQRLLNSAVQKNEALELQLNRTKLMFGDVFTPWETYAQTDSDGKLRRFTLIDKEGEIAREHVILDALRRTHLDEEMANIRMHLFRGNPKKEEIFFDYPAHDKEDAQASAFKTIIFREINDYVEMDKILYRLMLEASTLAQYSGFAIENYPPFLWEAAKIVYDNLLENPNKMSKIHWIELRAKYFESLNTFFSEDTDVLDKISKAFADLGANENLNEAGIEKLKNLQLEQVTMYTAAKELYKNLVQVRSTLQENLSGAFCITGSGADTYAIALLANALITNNMIAIAENKAVAFLSLIIIILLLVPVNNGTFLFSFVFCGASFMVTLFGFSLSFIISSFWVDPLIPSLSSAAGVLVGSFFALGIKQQNSSRMKRAINPFVPKTYIKKLNESGKKTSEIEKEETAMACIVVVRKSELSAFENKLEAKKFYQIQKEFRENVIKLFLKGGAVVIGCDSDSISFAFGSPIEKFAKQKLKKAEENFVRKAYDTVLKLYKNKTDSITASCNTGIDYGECVFNYSVLTGYTSAGSPVLRAKILSALTSKHNALSLISKDAAAKIEDGLVKPVEDQSLFFAIL
ncbi:MAG: hypothetical protein Ta2G_19720 [Termitinemataceae bacterium]|nr:MAG: hypothetical protein Ta2G_19720 [Termitinemataceae bacterium]